MAQSGDATLLWIENALPLNTRSERILRSLRRGGRVSIHVCAWDRDVVKSDRHEGPEGSWHVFRRETSRTRSRLLSKALGLPAYYKFIRSTLRCVEPDVVVCSFWDMALAASLFSGRRAIWYDVIDIPRGVGVEAVLGRTLERIALRKVSAVSLASRFYEPIYEGIQYRETVENLPDVQEVAAPGEGFQSPPRLGFVGSVRYPETIIPLLKSAGEMRYPVAVHGGGRALEMLREDFLGYSDIRFHGPYDYRNVPDIYATLDLVWAAYPAQDRNVKLAISNKFFESILFGVPGVFSRGTKLGQMVESLGIGFSLDPYDAGTIQSWLSRLQTDPDSYARVKGRLLDYRREMEDRLTWSKQDPLIVDLLDKTLTLRTA